MNSLGVTYSVADQSFDTAKSIGILNLSTHLAGHLARRPEVHRFTLLSNSTLNQRIDLPPTAEVQNWNQAIAGRWSRMLWDQWGVYRAAARTGNRWLFLPKGFASFFRASPVKLAVYIHDAVHALYAERYPRSLPRTELGYFLRSFRASLRHASLILTNSNFTKSELERLASTYSLPLPPVRRVGIGFSAARSAGAEKRDQLLVLTTIWPHKRADLSVKYLERWQRQTQYAGNVHWVGALPAGMTLPEFPRWRHHVRLPEGEYRRLLAESRALIYFSSYEGFGMPPVEAVLSRTWPVYSEIPATREVMAGIGGPFPNESYDAFAQALAQALAASPAGLDEGAHRLLERHNWQTVAYETVQALKEVDAF